MAAEALNLEDFDLAFHLQMEEAKTASLALLLLPSTSHSPPPFVFDVDHSIHVPVIEISDDEVSFGDKVDFDEFTQKRSKLGFDWFSPHFDNFMDVSVIETGTGTETGTSRCGLSNSDGFKLYCQGFVREERVGNVNVSVRVNVSVVAVEAMVCDWRNRVLMEVKKPLEAVQGIEVLNDEFVELMALIEGLEAALAFPFEKVSFFCSNLNLFLYISGILRPKPGNIANLVNKVALLRRKFIYSEPFLVEPSDVKSAFKLAKDSIVSQISLSAEIGKGKNLVENCRICFEDIDLGQMFTVDGCLHRYCFSCMKQHVEVKFLSGLEAKCPHEGCELKVSFESCHKLLPSEVIEIISQRLKEASIPVSEKVYCPDPKCSALMSKTEVLEFTKEEHENAEQSGARQCMKCHRLFCVTCKASWHFGMTCDEYTELSNENQTEDAQLKSLAKAKLWRPCSMCNHLVELAEGCYHITCRCGFEFCYTCGAEWKNKKPTCSCPIWDEHHIIRGGM